MKKGDDLRRSLRKTESQDWFNSKLASAAPNSEYADSDAFQKLKIKMGYNADLPPNSPPSE